jgi:hypothetical protein
MDELALFNRIGHSVQRAVDRGDVTQAQQDEFLYEVAPAYIPGAIRGEKHIEIARRLPKQDILDTRSRIEP